MSKGTSQESAFCYGTGGKQDFFSILILVISFTVREVLWGTCLIDSQEANSNSDWYKVFPLFSHKMFSWICSHYPWGSIVLGLKDLDITSPNPFILQMKKQRWRDVNRLDQGPKAKQAQVELEPGRWGETKADSQSGIFAYKQPEHCSGKEETWWKSPFKETSVLQCGRDASKQQSWRWEEGRDRG